MDPATGGSRPLNLGETQESDFIPLPEARTKEENGSPQAGFDRAASGHASPLHGRSFAHPRCL